MKKAIIITSLIVSGLIILDTFNAGHAFMMFLLAGIIPGTDIAISASTMMEVFALLTGLVVGRLSSRGFRALFARLPQTTRV